VHVPLQARAPESPTSGTWELDAPARPRLGHDSGDFVIHALEIPASGTRYRDFKIGRWSRSRPQKEAYPQAAPPHSSAQRGDAHPLPFSRLHHWQPLTANTGA